MRAGNADAVFANFWNLASRAENADCWPRGTLRRRASLVANGESGRSLHHVTTMDLRVHGLVSTGLENR